MAVGRLSMAWIRQVVAEVYPEGVLRRALLDHFALLLVSPKSSKGAKGRLARRLYRNLVKLQRRGFITLEDGIVRPLTVPGKLKAEAPPDLGPVLERLLFKALLAEDGQGDGHTPTALRAARWAFLASAIEAGWTIPMAAAALGIKVTQAEAILQGVAAQRQ
ncbi:MAG TPA: hypothetical protein VJ486_08120 [Geothrix sp.]|nr:hypothetical protein [Geothrix sp.]